MQVDIHDVEVADGGSSPHVHMMVSARKMFSVGFAKRKARELERMSRGDFGNWIKRQVDELLEKAAGIKLLNPMRPSKNERQTHSQKTADPKTEAIDEDNGSELVALNNANLLLPQQTCQIVRSGLIDDIKFIEGNLDVLTSNIEHLEQCITKYASGDKHHLNKLPNPFFSPDEGPRKIVSAEKDDAVKARHSSPMGEYHRKLDDLLINLPTPSVTRKKKAQSDATGQDDHMMESRNDEPAGVVVVREDGDLPHPNENQIDNSSEGWSP